MNSIRFNICFIVLGIILIACNSGEMPTDTNSNDSTSIVSTDGSPATDRSPVDTAFIDPHPVDSTIKTVDTIVTPVENNSEKRKNATLGYSYPPVMRRDEVKNINVYVLIKNQESRIRDTLRAITQEQAAKYDDNDSVSIEIRNVIWYKALDITLIDPAGDFKIVPIHNSGKQVIDTVRGNKWRWSIQTKTDKKETEMILKVVAEKEDGTVDHFDDRTIHIEIRIERNIFRRFLHYMLDKPEVSVPILVSLFGFLGWYIKRRVEKNK
jgi:hypothetical protein